MIGGQPTGRPGAWPECRRTGAVIPASLPAPPEAFDRVREGIVRFRPGNRSS